MTTELEKADVIHITTEVISARKIDFVSNYAPVATLHSEFGSFTIDVDEDKLFPSDDNILYVILERVRKMEERIKTLEKESIINIIKSLPFHERILKYVG